MKSFDFGTQGVILEKIAFYLIKYGSVKQILTEIVSPFVMF